MERGLMRVARDELTSPRAVLVDTILSRRNEATRHERQL
jgi:hypothetical protein